jgi:glyceraldehyde-3-phosphate dehydrogenase (NADP+)
MPNIFDEIKSGNTYKILVNGQWVESSAKQMFEVTNPADGSLIASVQKATKEDAERAVQAAFDSKPKIAGMELCNRADMLDRMAVLLERYKDDFIEIICKESGKTRCLAEGEVHASIIRLRYASDEAKAIRGEAIEENGKTAIIIRQPLGVVLAITPFNYPLFTGIAKIAPAIAAGNSIVVKTASDDPICLLMFGKIMQEAGMPDGTVNVLSGPSSEIGDYLCSHPKVNMISFTGSTSAGKHIAGIAGMKKLQMELGGKGAAIVLEDCDMELAVKECAIGSLNFSGQRCDAIGRILVVDSVADEFVKGVLKEVGNWKFGDPRDKDTVIGPLINERSAKHVEELVNDAVAKGAKLLCGGKRHNLGYYEPTVLDNVTKDMRIAWEETFGPVVTIIRVKNYEEAIKLANESQYGLDSCIFTKDVKMVIDAGKRLESGAVHINAHPTHGVGIFPFGGDKDSGMGREGVKYSVEEMSKVHTIVLHN